MLFLYSQAGQLEGDLTGTSGVLGDCKEKYIHSSKLNVGFLVFSEFGCLSVDVLFQAR